MNIYVSISPSWWGGGANTFAGHMARWCRKHDVQLAKQLEDADSAIVIAASADPDHVARAKARGCFIIHRLDEHFEKNESGYHAQKHQRIIELNKLSDVTVFQSQFVRQNVLPYLNTAKHTVILNGGNPRVFYPNSRPGNWIGHVTWGVGEKKRLDLLEEAITRFPQERFLLVGNHAKSGRNFRRYANVRQVGRMPRFLLPFFYRRMKILYFPSENDPCPNTAIEAILSGVPVAYHPQGGTKEIVKDGGLPIDQIDDLMRRLPEFRARCMHREDLHFERTANDYMNLCTSFKEKSS